jgi:predicted lipoprotein with Yx(FWY)xxD motif
MPRDPWFVRCFERKKPAPAARNASAAGEQYTYSDVPEELEEKQGLLTWYRGIRTDLGRERLSRQKATTVSTGGCARPRPPLVAAAAAAALAATAAARLPPADVGLSAL